MYTGERASRNIREQYLASIMRQNIAFFDKLGAGEITTRLTSDTNLIQDGVSEKVGLTLTAVSTFVTAFVIAFIKYWKLALILTSTVLGITCIMFAGGRLLGKYKEKSLDAYGLGSTLAEEVLSSIRNNVAFGTRDKLAKHYDAHLAEAKKWGFLLKAILGLHHLLELRTCWIFAPMFLTSFETMGSDCFFRD
jgi:ATP-binding cassette subfamily B (MDR/TAP) protein 1